MCGIAGLFLKNSVEINVPGQLHEMSTTLTHRGPDDEGYVLFSENNVSVCGGNDTHENSWNNSTNYAAGIHINEISQEFHAGFAHRRLSIIDLSFAGHQPMCSVDGMIWVVINGEIYNYIELREELKSKGYSFKTQSDTEVLIKAYECWDTDIFTKLNGMWSFVLFDRRKNIWLGSRDRFGVKPMYYVNEPDFFAFASEQKALLKLPITKEINQNAIADFLKYGKVETDGNCMIQAIHELLPSHNFIFDVTKKTLQVQRYYSLPFSDATSKFKNISDDEIIKNVRSKIFNSIKLRLRADVPLGFCLSGGIDSSSIVGAAKSLMGASSELHAFTSVYNDKEFDELQWAKLVVEKHQLQWHQAVCSSDDLFSNLESIIYYQDSPLFSTSTYAQNSVMKKAHDAGIPILLDGQGGDELFAGYIPFYISFYTELIRKGHWGRLIKEWHHLSSSPLNSNILLKSLLKMLLDKILPASFRKSIYKKIHAEIRWMNPDVSLNLSSSYQLMPQYESGGMNHLLHQYFTAYFLKNLLRWEDRCSMQYSIESRTPFADDIDLIEYLFSLPSSYKIVGGQSKSLLRNALIDVLPAQVYQRTDKVGFSTPQQKWLIQHQNTLKTLLQDLAYLDNQLWVDKTDILNHWNEIFSMKGKIGEQDFVWRYVNYLIWLKSLK